MNPERRSANQRIRLDQLSPEERNFQEWVIEYEKLVAEARKRVADGYWGCGVFRSEGIADGVKRAGAVNKAVNMIQGIVNDEKRSYKLDDESMTLNGIDPEIKVVYLEPGAVISWEDENRRFFKIIGYETEKNGDKIAIARLVPPYSGTDPLGMRTLKGYTEKRHPDPDEARATNLK